MSTSVISVQTYSSPFGELLLGSYEEQLCLADWKHRKMRDTIDQRLQKKLKSPYLEESCKVIDQAQIQLEEYFTKKREVFDLPLFIVGTDFQYKVWKELMKIPYGETASYLELSTRLGDPKAIRAAATANGANAISIIVPCHRIIGSDGKMVGYAGGVDVKKKLLKMEGVDIFGQMNLFE